jgi:hypothetical protein
LISVELAIFRLLRHYHFHSCCCRLTYATKHLLPTFCWIFKLCCHSCCRVWTKTLAIWLVVKFSPTKRLGLLAFELIHIQILSHMQCIYKLPNKQILHMCLLCVYYYVKWILFSAHSYIWLPLSAYGSWLLCLVYGRCSSFQTLLLLYILYSAHDNATDKSNKIFVRKYLFANQPDICLPINKI